MSGAVDTTETGGGGAVLRERLASLTPREREVLRLVPQLLSNKAIAPAVGIEHESVGKALKRAMAKLGVNSRREAARLLLEAEAVSPKGDSGPPDVPLSPARPVADATSPGIISPSEPATEEAVRAVVREERSPFEVALPSHRRRAWLPLRATGDVNNDMSLNAVLLWVIGLPALGALLLLMGTIILALIGFILFGEYRRHLG